MENLTRDYLKGKFFEDKDRVISDYILSENTNLDIYTYTKGKVVIIDKDTKRAYSKNGYFFAVIIKNDNFINKIEQGHKEDIIAYADSKLAEECAKYVDVDIKIINEDLEDVEFEDTDLNDAE